MHLVIFDVDGTLTDTNLVDGRCYWDAVSEMFGLVNGQPDWSGFRHVTDRGIAEELCQRHLGRAIRDDEVNALRRRVAELLETAMPVQDPLSYQITGASNLLSFMLGSPEFGVALATGAFRPSAALKLRRAGLFNSSIPLASSDDAVARAQIMRIARRRAARKYRGEFSHISFVGDGVWDVKGARELGWNFVGIAAGEHAEFLRRAGASIIVPNFEPVSTFLAALQGAGNS
jgi:phosphoglycolate phosphatase-like HAD superfamily hydrolase